MSILSLRTSIKTAAIACICGLCLLPQFSQAGINDNLIAHWTFDDCTAKDVTNNGYDGTIKNKVVCEEVAKTSSKALFLKGNPGTFSSAGGHVLLPPIDFMSLPNYSICLWVKEIRMEHFHGETYISFGNYNSGELTIGHYYNEQLNKKQLVFSSGSTDPSSSGHPGLVVPFRPMDVKRFVHYCLVYDKGTVKGYRDSVLVGSVKQNTLIGTDEGALGRHWFYYYGKRTSTRFTGFFDDVRIYGNSLTDQEVALLFNTHVPVSGSIRSLVRKSVTCKNNVTGQSVIVADSAKVPYNCEAEGLAVQPGENVTITINGDVQ